MKTSQILQAKWKQIRGKAKEEWGKLAHDDKTRLEGQRDQVVGVVQEKYGSTISKAQKSANQIFKKLNLH